MATICSMLLILTVVAIALTQAYFPARFGQNGKLSRSELILFRAGSAVYIPFELLARESIWKRLLFFIRAVGLPTPDAAVNRLLGGIRAAVRNVRNTLHKMLPALMDYKRILYLTCQDNPPAKTGKYQAIVLLAENIKFYYHE